ncbi:hypothetical protein Pla86_27350 [Planctomycetes bacterium Pla86]|uniref:Four helix bundle protein n=2 Tax=Engelhardtia mirabilis TaxID=2528011 RepID=A0A518BL04_9BACT|nr:hypothetical protein Pla133_27360 [Planctomycetes bacterium Pla133]QDV01974.1 hypothetical protein Pla86_27350 [Planctomycetes bacterium Pla86]
MRATAASTGSSSSAAERALLSGLLAVCEGVHAYDADRKGEALRRARCLMSRCVGLLLIQDAEPEGEQLAWAARIESEVLPTLGGLIRWSEKLGRRER